jgi:hypothetical protein
VSDRRKKKWSELTRAQQRAILVAAAVQLGLQASTLWDLRRRSADELRGSKRWWTAAAFVNIVGPIAYFAFGRRGEGRKRRRWTPIQQPPRPH